MHAVSNSKMQYAAAIPWHARLNNYSLQHKNQQHPNQSLPKGMVGYYYYRKCGKYELSVAKIGLKATHFQRKNYLW